MSDILEGPKSADESAATDVPVVQIDDLGRLIRAKRVADRLTLEQAAQASGVPLATLARWERYGQAGDEPGHRVPRLPETRTLALLARWLNVPLSRVLDIAEPSPANSIPHHVTDSVPDIVAAHLRADRKLDPRARRSLAELFRLAYQQFAQLDEVQDGEVDDPQLDTNGKEAPSERPARDESTHS